MYEFSVGVERAFVLRLSFIALLDLEGIDRFPPSWFARCITRSRCISTPLHDQSTLQTSACLSVHRIGPSGQLPSVTHLWLRRTVQRGPIAVSPDGGGAHGRNRCHAKSVWRPPLTVAMDAKLLRYESLFKERLGSTRVPGRIAPDPRWQAGTRGEARSS